MPPQLRRDSAQPALCLLGLTSLVFLNGTETVPFTLGALRAAPATAAGLLAIWTSQLLGAVGIVRRTRTVALPAALLVLLLGGTTWVVGHAGSFPALDLLVPGYWLLSVLLVSLRTGRRGLYVPFSRVAILATMVAQAAWEGLSDWEDLADQLWIAQPGLATLLFGDAIIIVARAHERALEREAEATAQHREVGARAAARREAARLLHDHVLHALAALSGRVVIPGGAAVRGNLTPQMVVAQCREAWLAMTHAPGQQDSVRVEELLAGDAALARTGAQLVGTSAPVPAGIAEVVAAAAHEALGNVAKHARARHVQVLVDGAADHVDVQVVDDGQGFDPSRRPADRLGVGRSIHQRLDDIGGQATITSAPGKGTRVELRWPAHEQDAEHAQWLAAPTRVVRATLTHTAWPGLVTTFLMTLLVVRQVHHPVAMLTVSMLALGAGCAAAVVLLRRALHGWELAGLAALAVVAWAANLCAVPTAPELDYVLWLGWGISVLVHLVVLSSGVRTGTAMAAGWLVVETGGLLLAYHDPMVLWDHSFVLLTGSGDVFLTVLVLVVQRRLAQAEAIAAAATSRRRSATAQLAAREHLDEFWSRRVTEEALPLLRDVAEGRRAPLDPQVQARARELEALLRDELVLGPERAELALLLARVRGSGWGLVSTLSPDDSDPSLEAARRVLDVLGTPQQAGQRVTVSAGPGAGQAVVLGASGGQVQAWQEVVGRHGGRLDVDEDFVRIGIPALAA